MQQSQRRIEVLGPLKERACKAAGSRLEDKLALQLAIACSMRETEDLVEFIAPRHVAAAGLAGILNERPSGGFLHSLARQLAALEKAFEACDRAKQS